MKKITVLMGAVEREGRIRRNTAMVRMVLEISYPTER
jgi:hypothetical protein